MLISELVDVANVFGIYADQNSLYYYGFYLPSVVTARFYFLGFQKLKLSLGLYWSLWLILVASNPNFHKNFVEGPVYSCLNNVLPQGLCVYIETIFAYLH